jgi:hypothetical protein
MKWTFETPCISLFDAVFLALEVWISFMLRGAIFFFSISLFSCATKTVYEPPPSLKGFPPAPTLSDIPLGEREVEQAGKEQEVKAGIAPSHPPKAEISIKEPIWPEGSRIRGS